PILVSMSSTFVTRARDAFGDTLERLGMDSEAEDTSPEDLGHRAAILVGAGRAWDRHLGPMLGASELAQMLGIGTRQAVHDRARRGGLLALRRGSRQVRFPAFQVINRPGSVSHTVLPGLGAILEVFDAAGVDAWTVASWFCTPSEVLEAMTPARWLGEQRDPNSALDAAKRSAARLGQ
ncbi:MAG: hypothetical protein ACRDZQ_05825, partial [Acidimicrobiales bacterium]